jgi:IS30 family transposase
MSGFTQDQLNAIAWQMNHRPRKVHGFRTSLQVYNEILQLAQMPTQEYH